MRQPADDGQLLLEDAGEVNFASQQQQQQEPHVALPLPLDVPDEEWDTYVAARRSAAAVTAASSAAVATERTVPATTHEHMSPMLGTHVVEREMAIATGLHITRLWSVATQLGLMDDEETYTSGNSASAHPNGREEQYLSSRGNSLLSPPRSDYNGCCGDRACHLPGLAKAAFAAAASLPTGRFVPNLLQESTTNDRQPRNGRVDVDLEIGDLLASKCVGLQCSLDDLLGVSSYIGSLEAMVTRLQRQNVDLRRSQRRVRVSVDENTTLFETLTAAYANSD